MGSGFALAEGGKETGMSKMLADALKGFKDLDLLLILFIICASAQFITEFTSNVAVASVMLPVLSEMAATKGVHPLYLMFPAALSCSMAFHMPVGTPPNAIVAGVANIPTSQMALAGIGPTIITLLTVWGLFPTYGVWVYPELNTFEASWFDSLSNSSVLARNASLLTSLAANTTLPPV